MAETGILNTVSAARVLARHIREKYPAQRAEEIALKFGIEIARDEWTMANARVIYLAECSLRPPKIMLNLTAIRMLAERAQGPTSWQPGADFVKQFIEGECDKLAACRTLVEEWFTETGITEAVTAHELYHILAQQPSSPRNEPAAHAFAQELLRLPFSLQLYEKILLTE